MHRVDASLNLPTLGHQNDEEEKVDEDEVPQNFPNENNANEIVEEELIGQFFDIEAGVEILDEIFISDPELRFL